MPNGIRQVLPHCPLSELLHQTGCPSLPSPSLQIPIPFFPLLWYSLLNYEQKSAKISEKRIPDFVKEVVSLYESIEVGAVSRAEILETFEELSGMKLEREWREIRNEHKKRNG